MSITARLSRDGSQLRGELGLRKRNRKAGVHMSFLFDFFLGGILSVNMSETVTWRPEFLLKTPVHISVILKAAFTTSFRFSDVPYSRSQLWTCHVLCWPPLFHICVCCLFVVSGYSEAMRYQWTICPSLYRSHFLHLEEKGRLFSYIRTDLRWWCYKPTMVWA